MQAVVGLYTRYALGSLVATVLTGVWLRLAMLRPEALAGFEFRSAVHAHSHLALFGWVTLALFAAIAREAGAARGWMRWHAHAAGLASVAAWIGFLRMGYAPATIALSTVHVALWIVFAVGAWPALARLAPAARRCARAALALLVAAGAGAMAPAIASVTGIGGAWGARLSIELFLSPFLEGWLTIGVAGALYASLARPRFAAIAPRLMALGALPTALFRVAEPAPVAWLPHVGRVGLLCVGVGALLLALDVLRERRVGPLARLAGAAFLVKGAIDVGVAAVASPALMANHQLGIAYLHLVLLGGATAGLLHALAAPARIGLGGAAIAHAVGLALLLAALLALGAPAVAGAAASLGLGVGHTLAVALVGGAVSALALIATAAALLRPPAAMPLAGAPARV
ncbi:MAG TPA: hypothetical protein VEA99_10110 [Gemmatimonadaceae bacterium]|nr:hypothetical protein [Gemmatimonadaceae bacterium]